MVTSKLVNVDFKLQHSYNYKKLDKFYNKNEDINVNGKKFSIENIKRNK